MSASRAAVFRGEPGRVELRDFTTPEPVGSEALVRVLGCTLCGSDLHTFEGRRQTPTPTVLGHEIVGRVAAFGPGHSRLDMAGEPLEVGDAVTWAIVADCGHCFFCEHDLPQKCSHAVKYGHEPFSPGRELLGGLAEHCLLAAGTSLVRLPAGLPLEVACPANCATATVAAAAEAAGDLRGARVCVLGAGLLGLTLCAMARSSGAAEVVCVELNPERRELSRSFGATRSIAPDELPEAAGPRGFDAAVELTGSPEAFRAAWPHLRLGGVFVLIGSVFPAPPVELPLEQVVRRCLTVRGVHNYGPRHLLAAMRFLAENHQRYPFAEMVSGWHPLERVDEAFAAARGGRAVRVGVRP